jgi:TAG lipase / steryl ester hydrolase / phospholipase A2 / LPA acyltransferase
MVLSANLPRAPLLYVESGNGKTTKATTPREENPLPPRPSLSKPRRGLVGPAARIFKGVNNTVLQLRDGLTEEQRLAEAKKEERRQILTLRMSNAETMEQWRASAKELDVLEGNEAWKFDNSSADFDAALIQARLVQLDEARTNCDMKKMILQVRTALSRELGGMGNINLYKHSYVGTKDLIERYIDSTLDTIRALVAASQHPLPDGIETKDILEQVVYARQAFGRSALLLSGGATFGMSHVGVLKALYEEKLLPRIISGASAGSIVCAVLCTRTDEEIPEVLKAFPFGDLSVFDEEGREDGILDRVRRLLTEGALIDIKHLIRVMQGLLGDMTFQEAYNRTRRILNICVSSASIYELPRLLNYITSPNVMIWSAVAASCSVPVLFSAAQLLVKNPITGENTTWNPTPQRWIDGSVDNDLPMNRLAEMFNVNHFIVSQVNPHVVPFLAKDGETIASKAPADGDPGPGWVYTLTNLAKDEALHRMHMLAELGIFPNLVSKARSVLSQKYSGDITILPEVSYKDFSRILKNPTSEFMIQTCLSGERATWPRLSRIKNRCAVELELDVAVQTLRAGVVFSPSQVDLRRMTTENYYQLTKRNGRRRRDSSSNIRRPTNNEEKEDTFDSLKKRLRPPLRTTSSHWMVRQHMPPLAPLVFTSSPFSPLTGEPPNNGHQPLDMSSAGETTFSPPSSDADVDSHTDDSSAEPDNADNVSVGLGTYHLNAMNKSQHKLDLFSSKPITPATDHVLATSPYSTTPGRFGPFTLSIPDGKGSKALTEPNSPVATYRKLLCPPPGSMPGVRQ